MASDQPPSPGSPRGSAAASARELAAGLLNEIEATGRGLGGRLEAAVRDLSDRDGALVRQLVLGTLRWRLRIDSVLDSVSSRPTAKIDPAILTVLRMAVFQLLFLDRIPPHAAVDQAVGAVKKLAPKAAGFANAVLRKVARTPDLDNWPLSEGSSIDRLAIELSYPPFLVQRWCRQLGAVRARAALEAGNRPKPQHLLCLPQAGGREAVAAELAQHGVECVASRLSPFGLVVRSGNAIRTDAFTRGRFYVQDEASQAAALIPSLGSEERVLDLACGPGGKSLAMLAAQPTLELVAVDRSLAALGRLASNLRRLGMRLPVIGADLRRLPLTARFDRVVVDLPCSGTGTFRNHPELKWRINERSIRASGERAFELLSAAAGNVVHGGLMVAITCSIEPEENELAVERLVAAQPELERAALPSDDLETAGFERVDVGCWRLLPGDEHDGFTVSLIARR